MKNTIWEKRVPALISIGFIVISIAITSMLVKNNVIFESRAGPSEIPQDIRITNVSDTSFTVSYITSAKTIGTINFGTNKNLGQTVLDEQDSKNTVSPHLIHSITVKNLQPSFKYFFEITSGQNTFLNNDVPFEVSTGPTLKTPTQKATIAGNVIMPDGSRPTEGIVYIYSENAQPISGLIKPDVSYMLPVSSLRTQDLSSNFTLGKNTIFKMTILGDSLKSNVLLSSDFLSNIPTITLSRDYDFTVSNANKNGPFASPSAEPITFPSTVIEPTTPKNPQILVPKKDQGFSDQKPQLSGIAQPNEKVEIIIRSSTQIKEDVTSDANGRWTYRPSSPLAPGNHTISITTRGEFGILRTITQSFVVFASETQVSESVTPSGALAGKPTVTVSSTPTLAPTPTLLPTSALTSPPSITTNPSIPPPGSSSSIIFGIFGISIIALSFFLYSLARERP